MTGMLRNHVAATLRHLAGEIGIRKALATVAGQSLRLARTPPVTVLRDE